MLAVTGFGFFSGGTTSLALSLILLYGTGLALIVVIAGIYRLVKKSAVRRAENVPEDTAALAFVDTTRSATEELRDALRPQAATGRQYAPVARTVGPGVAMSDAVAAARAASIAAAVASAIASAAAAEKPAASVTVKAPAGTPAARGTAKTSVNKSAAAKNSARKQQKSQGTNAPTKNAAGKASAPKGRPANTAGVKAASPKRPGTSSQVAGKKRPAGSSKDAAAGKSEPAAAASAQQVPCGQPKGKRPSLVLAASNPAPQAARQAHEALSQKAS